jgi:hypothetical protein
MPLQQQRQQQPAHLQLLQGQQRLLLLLQLAWEVCLQEEQQGS